MFLARGSGIPSGLSPSYSVTVMSVPSWLPGFSLEAQPMIQVDDSHVSPTYGPFWQSASPSVIPMGVSSNTPVIQMLSSITPGLIEIPRLEES